MIITDEIIDKCSNAIIDYRGANYPETMEGRTPDQWREWLANPENAANAARWRKDLRITLEALIPVLKELPQ
jgi:hypothetical protein